MCTYGKKVIKSHISLTVKWVFSVKSTIDLWFIISYSFIISQWRECLLPQQACCFRFWLFKCQKCFNPSLVLTFYCETTWFSTHKCHAWARGNYKRVKGKHKWYQITHQKLKKLETFPFRVDQRGAFKLPPNQFSPGQEEWECRKRWSLWFQSEVLLPFPTGGFSRSQTLPVRRPGCSLHNVSIPPSHWNLMTN